MIEGRIYGLLVGHIRLKFMNTKILLEYSGLQQERMRVVACSEIRNKYY